MKKLSFLGLCILIISTTFFLLFFLSRGCSVMNTKNKPEQRNHSAENNTKIWTCAMHPFIRSNKPGKCPICGMTLIPLGNVNKDSGETVLELPPETAKLAGVQVSSVERKIAKAEIRLTGKIEYNESKTLTISTRFSGRIEKLFLNYIGAFVNKGDHLAEIFSPDVCVLQRELILGKNNVEMAKKGGNQSAIKEQASLLNAAQNKAKIWGLTNEQINKILHDKIVTQTFELLSPISGIVIKQNFLQGQYFKEGETLFVISDISELWLLLDAYELDIPFLRYGQKVEFSVDAYPGELFSGTISYINPILNETTRTIKIRVLVNNKDGKLKPGMFAHAVILSLLGEKGIVMAEDFKGKWISPMHPEIIKDSPGKCDICGMDLIPAEKFIQSDSTLTQDTDLPLVIPSTAPLITGKRAIVYVEKEPGKYEGREVILGPKVDDSYIVKDGLKEGEKVVTSGNFMIDSELQLLAKPSMMNLPKETAKNDKATSKGPAQNDIDNLYNKIWDGYFKVQNELVNTDLRNTIKAAAEIKTNLDSVNMDNLDNKSHKNFMAIREALTPILSKMALENNIDNLRKDFLDLSNIYKNKILQNTKPFIKKEIFEFHCPMVNDGKNGIWFQPTQKIANPYFDKSMRECGSLTTTDNNMPKPINATR